METRSDIGCYRRIFYIVLNSYGIKFDDVFFTHDDLFNEGYLAYLDAFEGYDEDKGKVFEAYAYSCVKNRILTYIICTNKRNSVGQLKFQQHMTLADPDVSMDLNFVANEVNLTDFQREMLDKHFFGGWKKRELQEIRNCTCHGKSALDYALRKMRRYAKKRKLFQGNLR